MSTESNEKKKEIKIGDSVGFSDSFTVIKIRGEANKELDRLAEADRQFILNEAVEISKGTLHPYDISLQEVLEAKKRRGYSP